MIEPVYCLGLCSVGPNAIADNDVHARLDSSMLPALIDEVADGFHLLTGNGMCWKLGPLREDETLVGSTVLSTESNPARRRSKLAGSRA